MNLKEKLLELLKIVRTQYMNDDFYFYINIDDAKSYMKNQSPLACPLLYSDKIFGVEYSLVNGPTSIKCYYNGLHYKTLEWEQLKGEINE